MKFELALSRGIVVADGGSTCLKLLRFVAAKYATVAESVDVVAAVENHTQTSDERQIENWGS